MGCNWVRRVARSKPASGDLEEITQLVEGEDERVVMLK